MITERSCRACHAELETILAMGTMHPSNFLRPDQTPLPKVPFDLSACTRCHLVQLRYTVEPDLMFRQYWYQSGINETMRAELASIVRQARGLVGTLTPSDLVIDIGANDGTLLAIYTEEPDHPQRVAYEPAENLWETLRPHTEILIPSYFPAPGLDIQKAKIITSIACFYDLDHPAAFVEAIKAALHPQGIWIVQLQDWDQMQKATAFDNICMEHLCYYSLGSIERLIAPFGLEIIHAETRAINGGSYRLIIGHTGAWHVDDTVESIRFREAGCDDWTTFDRFAWRARAAQTQIHAAVDQLRLRGPVDAYGASTKFNTLAQWCELDHTKLRQAWERSPEKWGLRTIGTDIPIVSEADGRADPPAALIAGIWQFRDAVLNREADFLASGGVILFPLPRVDLVSHA